MAKFKNLVDEIRRKRNDNIIEEETLQVSETNVENPSEVKETVKQIKRRGK